MDAVFDGQAALEYLEADNYDCVILDIMMPKVDGITVLKEMRKKGNLIPMLCKRQWRSLPPANEKVYHSASELVYQLLLKLFTTLVLIYGNARGTDIPRLA